jgi:hypothetical protein
VKVLEKKIVVMVADTNQEYIKQLVTYAMVQEKLTSNKSTSNYTFIGK